MTYEERVERMTAEEARTEALHLHSKLNRYRARAERAEARWARVRPLISALVRESQR